jgi:hypothetical protein
MPEPTFEARADLPRGPVASGEERNRPGAEGRAKGLDTGREPRGLQSGIADQDCQVRCGSEHERVRNTPPAGAWNDITHD